MAAVLRVLRALPLLILSPFLLFAAICSLAITDAVWRIAGKRREPADALPSTSAASVVIPNWNGRDLLERYLPSVVEALEGNSGNEVIVVDNGSTDGSADFVRQHFPNVKLLALDRNLGFGGGSNAGFRAARNDVVVLLNSDMRVDPGFLPPLLEGFSDEKVFAVSCQIFFSDPGKLREETGLTQGWWEDGQLRVRHRIDEAVTSVFPCFYGGGGSCAFDRHKFLELSGFDELLAPFYLEDTDLGFLAWKRGWKVLYQPRSIVFHEHRGTIGKRFSEARIQAVLKKNFLLFCWKNIHEWRRLSAHFGWTFAAAAFSVFAGRVPARTDVTGIWRAFLQLPGAVRSRWRARTLAIVSDTEAFLRSRPAYYRDRFAAIETTPEKLRVLFVSAYPILPPVHGGGVFMYGTLRELARLAEVHLITVLDEPSQLAENEPLRSICASAEFVVRKQEWGAGAASIVPHAVREFSSEQLEWLIQSRILLHDIDIVQLEYTPLGQYAGSYQRIACALFEHDIYFQSVARALKYMPFSTDKWKAQFEYLRALRYELRMLRGCDEVQVPTAANREYLAGFLPEMAEKIRPGLRAGIDVASYRYQPCSREPLTMLFLGSFRHVPNQVALNWFVRDILPLIQATRPEVRLLVAGSDPPPRHIYSGGGSAVELLGFVDDVREPLSRCSVFVCPILSGSGVRVKLLEAFASSIPTVSTRIGAEGLAVADGQFCRIADNPQEFARAVLDIFEDSRRAAEMSARARAEVEQNWDMRLVTGRLEKSYREILATKRGATTCPSPS
jgi:GT2 family glycosyltransferase/glycosyltransferase involved in cell wall biosynthesis